MAADRYLLDTHVIVWAVKEPERLSERARAIIVDGLAVTSVVSLWELIVKRTKPEAPVACPAEWWTHHIVRHGIDMLPVRFQHVARLQSLPDLHKDPFDRLLICQALQEELALVTADIAVRAYPVRTVW